MTNGDKVRNMTNEELADFLISRESESCSHCEYHDEHLDCLLGSPCFQQAFDVLKKWLSAEAEAVSERSEK